MIRFLDIVFSLIGLICFLPFYTILYVIGLFETGKPIFIQERVGKNKKAFKLIKFRTMDVNTESVATHLIKEIPITKFGMFMRKTKLDELPQLINVLKGDMSLVGARPCLFSQPILIEEREKRGVYNYVPGITGLGQIHEIDMSTPKKLARIDEMMYENLSVSTYFKYLFATVFGKGQGDRIPEGDNDR